jgi:ketosteroid isomerase-like protein
MESRAGQRNVSTVRSLWETTHREGIEAALSSVGADVEWQPFFAPGRSYTSPELTAYLLRLQAGRSLNAWLARVEAHGDHVLASGSFRWTGADGSVSDFQGHWVYEFAGDRLIRGQSHPSLAEARQAVAALEGERTVR